MGFLAWIVLGLIAGAIAKAIMPGPDGGGMIMTMLLGIVGAFVGGALGGVLFGTGLAGFSIQSFILAIIGAVGVLWAFRMTRRRRGTPSV